jgi:hypothetical protein
MLHFELELAEHGILLLTLILGCVFWLTVITIIALVLVADRAVEEAIHRAEGDDEDEDITERIATLDEDT